MACMRTNLKFPARSSEPSQNERGFCITRGYDYEEFPYELMESPFSEPFFAKRMKMLSRRDGFMLYGKLGVDFFSTSALLNPNMKNRLRLNRARPNFHMISDNPNVSLGIVDCSLYTRRIALKDDYHKKQSDMPAYTPVDFNYLETLAKIFITPFVIAHRQNLFFQEPYQQRSSSSNCYCNDYKLCLYRIIHWKSFLLWTIWSQTD